MARRSVPPGFGCWVHPGSDQRTRATMRLRSTSQRLCIWSSLDLRLYKRGAGRAPAPVVIVYTLVIRLSTLEEAHRALVDITQGGKAGDRYVEVVLDQHAINKRSGVQQVDLCLNPDLGHLLLEQCHHIGKTRVRLLGE